MDFSSIPYPSTPSYVVAQADFRGDETKNQLSFLKGDKLLVLRAKPGAPWAIGERVGSEVRGLYPVQFCAEAGPPGSTLRASAPSAPAPAAAAMVSPRPLANSAVAVRGTPLVQVPPSPRRGSSGVSSTVSPRPVAGPAPAPAPAPASVTSPRVVASSVTSPRVAVTSPVTSPRVPGQMAVQADFSLPPQDEEDEGEANANVFSGAAFASGDGLRYEFEREPEKHVMEVDKKKKASLRTGLVALSDLLCQRRRLRVRCGDGC